VGKKTDESSFDSRQNKRFLSFPKRPTQPLIQTALKAITGAKGVFTRSWIYTSTHPYAFMASNMGNFTLNKEFSHVYDTFHT
jgi:hypothetical protein